VGACRAIARARSSYDTAALEGATLASALGAESLLAAGGRVPLVLNGGIVTSPSGLLGLAAVVGVDAAVELATW